MTAKLETHRQLRRSLLLALLLVAPSASAWNAAGHRISALIAWERLDEQTRATVGAILRQHPDFKRWQARAKDADAERGAFLEASTWPDDIRSDKRFYTAGRETPTPNRAGFPDMERRLNWHYVDRADRVDRLAGQKRKRKASGGTLDRQLATLTRTLCDPKAGKLEQAYALPWLIHLVGDAHQPLHAASRQQPNGGDDSGGNEQAIYNPFEARHPSTNLHRYWDDLPGKPWLRGKRLEGAVRALIILYPPPAPPGQVAQWIEESWQLARQSAYPPGGEAVLTISGEFHANARNIAGRRLTEAGYRLADLLQGVWGSASEGSGAQRRQKTKRQCFT